MDVLPEVKPEDALTSSLRQPSVARAPTQEVTPFSRYLHRGRSAMDIRAEQKQGTKEKENSMPVNLVPAEVYKAISLREFEKWGEPLDTSYAK